MDTHGQTTTKASNAPEETLQEREYKRLYLESKLAGERTQHTPGPWVARTLPRVGLPYSVENESLFGVAADENGGGFEVAQCGMAHIEEAQANARLMAAAPDMLEALKDIVEQYEKTMLVVGADLADSIRIFGNNAIAKAEGK